ncbi:MAG: dTDP-4-dehydrorhamnose reductase [Stellaceae bacterium]
MNPLLVTGGTGQLARALDSRAPDFATLGFAPRRVGRPYVDFDRPATIDAAFAEISPALVINAAGWTAVDAAESHPDEAARANDTGPARLAALCADAAIPFVHISTDYVFDGAKGAPYVETDLPNPICVYGASKLAGEKRILALRGKSVILRTAWIYAAEGNNFVRTMLAAAQKHDSLRVVADQRGCPTSVDDLADAIFSVAERVASGWRDNYGGVFHAAGSGDTSWHRFAEAIFGSARRFGRPVPSVAPIATAEWPTQARRPADSRLDCSALADVFGIRLPDWRASLDRVVAEICQR